MELFLMMSIVTKKRVKQSLCPQAYLAQLERDAATEIHLRISF